MIFGISVYIAIIQLWKDGGYLQFEKVSGVSRFTLQQPTTNDCSPTADSCKNDFASLESLAYCTQSSLHYAGDKFPCQYYEAQGVSNLFESSILVTTRVTKRSESLVCDGGKYKPSHKTIRFKTIPVIHISSKRKFANIILFLSLILSNRQWHDMSKCLQSYERDRGNYLLCRWCWIVYDSFRYCW